MIRHIVLMKFRSDLAANTVAKAVEKFFALRETTGEMQSIEHGLNNSAEGLDHGFTHCFLINFADEAARERYLKNPAHLEYVAYILPMLADGLVVDFTPASAVRKAA